MPDLTIINYKNRVEQVLLRALRLAFLRRAVAADLAALAALDVVTIADGELCYVTAEGRVYEYSRYSSAAAASPQVITPGTLPGDYPSARWLRQDTPTTHGPNWRRPVHAEASGKLKAVELYSGDGGAEEMWIRVLALTPSLVLEHRADQVQPLSAGYPGSFYRATLSYALSVFSENLRPPPAASWGSPASVNETEDLGPSVILGEVRRVLAGLGGPELGLTEVDRIEIGDSRLVQEDLAERLLVWEADLKVVCFLEIPDEDLDAMRIDLQPELTLLPDPGAFDPRNYVAQGYYLEAGPGLGRSWPAGVAILAGSPVASTPQAKTFTSRRDTYCDLKADGTVAYLEVALEAPAPAVTSGALRILRVRTDGADVVETQTLCSYSQVFRPMYQVVP